MTQIEQKPEFSKELIIQDVVRYYPEVVETLMEYGLHCIGCHVSGFETIEEGAMGHGMSEDDVENMILDAKEKIEELQQTTSSKTQEHSSEQGNIQQKKQDINSESSQ